MGAIVGAAYFQLLVKRTNDIDDSLIRKNPFVRLGMYLFGTILLVAVYVVQYLYNRSLNWSNGAKVAYATLSPLIFAGGCCLLIVPALYGKAKFLTFLFKGQLLSILGRSVFMAGLLNPVIITFFFTTDGQALYL